MTAPALRFKAKGFDSPEAKALREFRSRDISKGERFGRNAFYSLLLMAFPLGLGMVPFVQFAAGNLLAGAMGVGDWIILSLPVAYTFALTGTSVLKDATKDEALALESSAGQGKSPTEELSAWLSENYGLSGDLGNMDLALLTRRIGGTKLELSTVQGGKLEAILVPVKDSPGSYELHKDRVLNTSESVYFDTVDSSNQLTANRNPAAALTAERGQS